MWWGKRADPLVVVGKGMEQNLGGYIAAELLVMATIDFPHTAAAQLLLNTVVDSVLPIIGWSLTGWDYPSSPWQASQREAYEKHMFLELGYRSCPIAASLTR